MFQAAPSSVARGKGKYCSYSCRSKANQTLTVKQSLIKHIDTSDPDGCWPWRGYLYSNGYGRLTAGNKHQLAHRAAYEDQVGPIPEGHSVLHRCDNRPCCRGAHLFTGTHDENMADMTAKNRGPKGERHPMVKLTDELVLEIRRLAATGTVGPVALGRQFGVTHSMINHIVMRKAWTHI